MVSAVTPHPHLAHAPLALLIPVFLMMQPLSTDLYLASLPGLTEAFDAPAATVQLTLSLFVLGFGAAQLVVGPLSDRFGRRPVVLSGLALYLLATVLCWAAPSIGTLIAARFLQALGCCAAVVIARAIVRDAYTPEQGTRVIARASSWMSLAPLLGPILGSHLEAGFGWRAAFVALGLLSGALLVLTAWRLPETNAAKDPGATQWKGVLRNYRAVLGARAFWAHALPGALSYGAIFAFIAGSPFVLIRVLHVPAAWFGYCFAFGVSGYLAGTIVCRRLLGTQTAASVFRIGSTLSLLSGAGFAVAAWSGAAPWWLVTLAMFLTMLAHGINFPIAQSGSVSPFPLLAGTAAGLMGALTMLIAFVVGLAVGASHDGTALPLALLSGLLGAAVFLALRLLALKETA
jgi:DHA1 family bicyclomycin/chloramphenicol resistance-like MFS transporter